MLLALAAGCGRDVEADYSLVAGLPEDDAAEVVHDLAAELEYARCWLEKERIETGSYADRAHLTDGWSFPNPDLDVESARHPCLWAEALEAGLALHLREVAPRRLRFLALGYLPKGVDEIRVAVRLNGDPLEGFVLGRMEQSYELALPARRQRAGENRLTFSFSHAARPIDHGDGKDLRRLSGCFGRFELEIEDPAVLRRLRAAHALQPGGSGRALEGRAIEQVSGSLLRYHARVPEHAVFTAQLGFVRRHAGSGDAARFRLTAARDGAEPLVLLDELVPWTEDGGLDPVRVPLDGLAGQVVALELSLAGASQEPVVGAWGAPRISVPAQPPGPTVPSLALDEARRRLRRAPVVAILLDAFNPTFMTAYGGRANLTPTLDRIAAEGVLFERAFAQATYTLASVGRMLTSRPAQEHGVWDLHTPLRPGVETWPERFAAAGYRTAAIVCSVNGSSTFGFERGFETFVEAYAGLPPDHVVQAEDVLPHLERVLAGSADDDRPLFLWLHILEPHEPYDDSPAPWRGRFDPEYDGELTGTTQALSDIRDGLLVPSARDLEHLKAEYEEGLGYVDEVLGRIRARLAEANLLEDGVLAVFSDHGEAFMDHRPKGRVLISHGSTVYDEMARVPLLIRLPARLAELGARGRRAGQRVGSGSVLLTLADLVGVEPPEHARGASFASLLFDPQGEGPRFTTSHAFTLAGNRFMPEFALWGDGYKYIYRSGGGDELYVKGAREEHDLSDELRVRAGWMRQELQRKLGYDPDVGVANESAGSTELTPEVLEQMRALGYAR